MIEGQRHILKSPSEEISTIQELEGPLGAVPTSTRDWYLSEFDLFEKNLDGHQTARMQSIRREAIGRFAEMGFPTTRDEEWKYTDVSPLTHVHFKPVASYNCDARTRRDLDRLPFADQKVGKLLCVNGRFARELSSFHRLPAKLYAGSLMKAMGEGPSFVEDHLTRYARLDRNAFTALNTAFFRDGFFVHIPDGVILEAPLQLFFVSSFDEQHYITNPRTLIIVGKNAHASIVEVYVSLREKVSFTNAVTEVVLGENSTLEHTKFVNEAERTFHIGTTHFSQGRNSNLTSHVITLGGAIARNEVVAVLDGEGGEATLNGLYLGMNRQLIDNHTTIDHAKPHCSSHEVYKGILGGESRGVFNGKIIVRPDAQKTDAKQTNKNLLLSDSAAIDTKPQLEIFANDVKCTHGATIGQLEEEAVFYLRSRGVGLSEARKMLIYAFASDIIERIAFKYLRKELERLLHAKLDEGWQKKEA